MKKRLEVLAILGVLTACYVGARNNMVFADTTINPQKTISIAEDEQIKLAKFDYMKKAKREAEQKYTEDLQVELASAIATKQRNEEPYVTAMAAEMEKKVSEVQERCAKEQAERVEKEADESLDELMKALDKLEQTTSKLEESNINNVVSDEALVEGTRMDEAYTGCVITIEGENRANLERLVMSEAGGEGFVGAALVAQTIHDTMIRDGIYDVLEIKRNHAYEGSLDKEPNDDVKRAVAYIFDKGGIAVKHRLVYFYAFKSTNSPFHETCKFVLEYGGHRFFDDWSE